MQLRAIIIDDEQKGIDSLKLLIDFFVKDIKVVASTNKPIQAIDLIENYKPEVVFLDINMPELNGFELLEKLAWKDFNLIFTTAHQEYALRALKNEAIDYLLKPIDHEDLRVAIDRVVKQISTKGEAIAKFNYNELYNSLQQIKRQHILVNTRLGMESIDLNDILYFESQSNYTNIYLSDTRIVLTSKTMKEFETMVCINDSTFMRVHNSFIVNLSKVSRYLKTTEQIMMSGDQKIPLAKSKREAFFEWLNV